MTIQIIPQIIAYTALEQRAIQVLDSCRKGTEQSAVSKKLCIGYEAARDVIFEIRKKEAIRMAKLTDTQKAAIFQSWKDGITMAELAKQYGVTVAAISILIKKMRESEGTVEHHATPTAESAQEIPAAVRRAIQEHILTLQDQIDQREQRISELRIEQEEFQKDIDSLREWEAKQI